MWNHEDSELMEGQSLLVTAAVIYLCRNNDTFDLPEAHLSVLRILENEQIYRK